MPRPPPRPTLFPYTTLFRSAAKLLVAETHADLTRGTPTRFVRRRTNRDRKSTRLNSSHRTISYAVFCLKKKNTAECTDKTLPTSSALTSVIRFFLHGEVARD